MAGDNDKGKPSGDPIERAMARRAEAEKAARETAAAKTPRDSVIGSAMAKARPAKPAQNDPPPPKEPSSSEPVPAAKDTVYEPDEGSFFAPSATERAEQARRAAQRVRRRARGMEPDFEPAPEPMPQVAEPEPTIAEPEPKPKPVAAAPVPPIAKAEPETPVAKSTPVQSRVEPAAPVEPKPRAEQPAARPSADDLITRASQRSAKAARPPEPKVVAQPAARPVPPPTKPNLPPARPPAAQVAKVPPPKPEVPAFAKMASAVPLMDRITLPGKPAKSVQTPATPKPITPPKAPASKTVRAAPPQVTTPKAPAPKPPTRPQSAPVIERAEPAPLLVPSLPKANESFEAAFTDTPDDSAADSSIYAAPSVPKSAKTKAFAPFEWMIASRYLRARKKEGFVSVIAGFSLVGIALGVATLIVVMAVMTGFRETLITQIIGGSPHINVVAQGDRFTNFDALADNLRKVDGVQYVAPVVESQVLATGKRNHSGVYVRGIRKSDLVHLIDNASPEFTRGSLTDFTPETNVAAVGANLAAKLGLRVGDYVSLTSPDGDITPMSVDPMPRKKAYKIVYAFKLGVQEVDYGVVFLPFEEAQIYLNKQGVADKLDIFVDDPNNVDAYSDPIFQAARSSISLYNWKTSNGRLIGAINLERQVMFVILTMIILVAALNIISGLVMLVKDKSRDVAIMRTMGMARGSILRIFFICGSSIGVIGSLLGVALGVAFVWNIKSVQTFVEWATGTTVWDPAVRAGMTEIPTKMQFSDVSLTLFIALGLSFIATLYPAWKAAKLDPVEALRYE